MRKGRPGTEQHPHQRIVDTLRTRARELKRDTLALYLAAGDPRTPWLARVWLLAVAAYALSPIDLIPDVIPVFGYLDDLLLVPLGIWLGLQMIPRDVLDEARERASQPFEEPGTLRRYGTFIIAAAWLVALVAAALLLRAALRGR